VLILAHRGASAQAPENTLDAFLLAAAQGADGVELDAMVCKSGEVVVCHDVELSRLARVPLRVDQTPLKELRELDVGSPLGFSKARIPLLEEVMEALPPHVLINIELKCDTFFDMGLSHKVGALVRAKKLEPRVLVSSFNGFCLRRFGAAYPDVRRGYLLDPDRSFWLHGRLLAPLLSNHSVHPHESKCTVEHVARWRARGLKVASWTVDSAARASELQALGVDYLITNQPSAMREVHRPNVGRTRRT
jgi:glycerophosphoryl diester phosphodiesterase